MPKKNVRIFNYFVGKGYSPHYNIHLAKWGKLKADLLCFNAKENIVCCILCDSVEGMLNTDYTGQYMTHCTHFYLVCKNSIWEDLKRKNFTPMHGIGVIVYSKSKIHVEIKAIKNKMEHSMYNYLIKKVVCWVNNKPANTKKVRVKAE